MRRYVGMAGTEVSVVSLVVLLVASTLAPEDGRAADDVRFVTFRYMFGHNASGQQQNAKAYCLEVDGKDPSDALIARFAGSTPPVKKASECTTASDVGDWGVRVRVTREPGLLFRLGAIRWVKASMVEVEGGYYEASLSASSNTYYLEKKNGDWKVVRDVMDVIS
jgi:hypothetical protein